MTKKVLEVKDLAVYHDDNLVLSNVNINIEEGEFCYLIGKTGSGKSSFMRMIYGDLPLSDGNIYVDGENIYNISVRNLSQLRRRIGIVFQDFKLLSDRSVYKNLEFVLRATGWKNKYKIRERINLILKKVNMHLKGYQLPHELSAGEQQRVAIARAILNNPTIIIADEPTGNLDPITSQEILDILKTINKEGTSILMATHDYSLILKNPGKTLRCENNTIINLE